MSAIYPQLNAYISRYVHLTDDELALFQQYLTFKSFRKKEFLLEKGQICRSRFFILKGCFRQFYIDQKGQEQIVHFGIENWWMTNYASLLEQSPSDQYIQAIETAEILELKQSDFEELCKVIPQAERFFRIIAERTNLANQRRLEFMFSMSAEEMYRYFVEVNPDFAQRVPQYMLASYLGFSAEFLSKIRSKK